MQFHTLQRLFEHVDRDSPFCLAVAFTLLDPLDKSALEAANARKQEESRLAKARGLRATAASKVCFRVQGPLRRIHPSLSECTPCDHHDIPTLPPAPAGDFDPDDPDLDPDPDPPSEPESDPYIGVVPEHN